MKVAFFEIENWEKDYLKKEFKDFTTSFFTDHLEPANAELAKACDII